MEDEQSQKDEMRAAVRGDRERALERWRGEGREPVFGPPDPEASAEPEAPAEPEPALEPEPAPEPEPTPEPVAAVEPEAPVAPEPPPARRGWLRRLFGRG